MMRVLDQFQETFRETPPPFALPLAIGSCRSQIELHRVALRLVQITRAHAF